MQVRCRFGEASLRSALPLRGLPASQGDGLRSATLPPVGWAALAVPGGLHPIRRDIVYYYPSVIIVADLKNSCR